MEPYGLFLFAVREEVNFIHAFIHPFHYSSMSCLSKSLKIITKNMEYTDNLNNRK